MMNPTNPLDNLKAPGSLLEQKTSETKVFRDPIHGYIRVEYQIIWDLINSREFQRLRRIHQLGGVSLVYHNAEHTRFSHSLGVYELCRRMITEVDSIRSILNQQEQITVLIAALLHDIGHGPYSHFFESISKINHEDLGTMIIESDQTEINQILEKAQNGLSKRVTSILKKESEPHLMSSMISSQIDADRMDFLLRDAFETGTTYGNFDLERILRTLRADQDSLFIKKSGIHAVEDYIMARYQMYFQVYQHPDSYGYELLIERFFKRLEQIENENQMMNKDLDPDKQMIDMASDLKNPLRMLHKGQIHLLDETLLNMVIRKALDCHDEILKDLAERIINRKLFKWMDQPGDQDLKIIRAELKKHNLPESIYLQEIELSTGEYLPYHEKSEPILVLDMDGSRKYLSECSAIAKALLSVQKPDSHRIYFPELILDTLIKDQTDNKNSYD